MPLVVPGLSSKDGDQGSWMEKLAGKKIGDSHNETTFAKTDLPEQHRVIQDGGMSTTDFNPKRLNIYVNNDGTVKDVKHG